MTQPGKNLPPLIHLCYPLDIERLLDDAMNAKKSATGFNEKRAYQSYQKPLNHFKISKYTSEYIEKIMEDLGVKGSPRFYFQSSESFLDWHTDINTRCSVNMVLSADMAPISFQDGDIFYRQALLNTTVPHAVKNGKTERILFKISVFDQTFEQVASKIAYRTG